MKHRPTGIGFQWSLDVAHIALKDPSLWKRCKTLQGLADNQIQQHWSITQKPVFVTNDAKAPVNVCAKSTQIPERVIGLFPKDYEGNIPLVFSSGENTGWLCRLALAGG